ncbi:MAG: hypothetical protein JW751_29310 [Polyangiaceae bacterium]|nr:hypothetical protein [Polyangiaceae bacterium]
MTRGLEVGSPRWRVLTALLCFTVAGCATDPQQQSNQSAGGNGAVGGSLAAGGGPATGGNLSGDGGAPTGGFGATATGGALTGGASSGGVTVTTGGLPTGGASSGGGFVTGGGPTSGGNGGSPTGGVSTGGLATGGITTGGVSTGGTATGGGSPTGGIGTGGLSAGGVATDGGGGGAETGGVGTGGAGNRFRVYLLIGQSNMAGGADTEPGDLVEDPRIRVLGYDDCAQTGRVYNEWDTASPPLHACWSNGIGPGDHFAKTLSEALPGGDTIGLVPCAIPGVDLDFFVKGVVSARRNEFTIPPDNHWDSAYDWVIERAQLAQNAGGVIDGVIFHQGESDSSEPNRSLWMDKVKGMVEDLRADLGGEPFPFVAGELLYSGCCGTMNTIVNQLPDHIPNTYVASAAGLNGVDQYHFDAPGVRTIGRRYGEAMIGALGLGP